MNGLFTLIFEFKGGTHISQVESDSPMNSVQSWLENLKTYNNQILDSSTLEKVEGILLGSNSDYAPVPVKDLKNVWCTSFTVKKNQAFLNIVKTA